jgi:hypothetical protein
VQPRKHNRYRVDAPVSFIWRDGREVQHEGMGLTRDIGLGGVFVFTQACPPLEVSVHVELVLPRLTSEARTLLVQGDGQVTRVEPGGPSGTGGGFAATIKRFLLRAEEGALTEDGFLTPCEPGN